MGRDFVRNGELIEAFWSQKDVAVPCVCRRDAVGWGWAGLAQGHGDGDSAARGRLPASERPRDHPLASLDGAVQQPAGTAAPAPPACPWAPAVGRPAPLPSRPIPRFRSAEVRQGRGAGWEPPARAAVPSCEGFN